MPDLSDAVKASNIITTEQARFIVRVMDSLVQHPSQLDDDIKPERAKLDVLYQKHDRWREGSERGRAEWLIDYLNSLGGGEGKKERGE